jgi:polyribonucleotide nucleotidyltransferase
MQQKKFSTTFAGKELTISIGKFAPAANSAVMVQMGETILLVTAVMSDNETELGYFPLMVDYEEKMYAAGRIKGSRFIKREGRPSDEAVLVGRFIDRAIRPLFPANFKREVQIIATTLSFDEIHDPDILALIGASAALHVSNIPWEGPIGAIRMSKLSDSWIANPSYEQRHKTAFDLDIAGDTEKVIMIEARANEATEEEIIEAFTIGRKELRPVIALIEKIRAEIGKEKYSVPELDNSKQQIIEQIKKLLPESLDKFFFALPLATKKERGLAKNELMKEVLEKIDAINNFDDKTINWAKNQMYDLIQEEVGQQIIDNQRRLDGRGINEVRDLIAEIELLPRTHGTGHFSRGETQVLSVCTLGAPGDQQTLDSMEHVGEKRYMHHYNFPPFSVGEAKPLRGAGRREIGHGALAEKALEPVMPSKEEFPYTIRVVSEVLNSNGSSSMASTCGSSLALMDAGVPIKAAVAGIAIGIATQDEKWQVFTDLQDLEDGPGGMDFKVAGTKKGITAIQMDTKTKGLTHDMIIEALNQAKQARLEILDVMNSTISEPKAELSPYAPRILTLKIHPDKIREVIGPGGKMINEIIASTGIDAMDIENDGTVMITAKNLEAGQKAYNWVNDLTREIQVGETFDGKVERTLEFGAIVAFGQGKDGMVHISELAPWRVEKVDDIVKVGDTVKVKVVSVDSANGRISLSMKQAEGNIYPEKPQSTHKPVTDSKKPFSRRDDRKN